MKKKRYILVEEQNEERLLVYGIAFVGEKLSKNAPELYRVSNVTCDKKAMKALVQRCNSLHLSPIHLNEVIDDFLLLH